MKPTITVGHLLAHRDDVERPKTLPVKRRHGRRQAVRRDRSRH
jgi:hypothetical protein